MDDKESAAEALKKSLANLEAIFRSLGRNLDGQAVIVGATVLDRNLKRTLLTVMRSTLSRDQRDRIFDGYGPLGTFAAKIDIAYALGLVSKTVFQDLRALNAARVLFAHSHRIRNFHDPEVIDKMNKISGLDPSVPDMLRRFMKRLKEIDVQIEGPYVWHCQATGQIPTDVDPSLLTWLGKSPTPLQPHSPAHSDTEIETGEPPQPSPA